MPRRSRNKSRKSECIDAQAHNEVRCIVCSRNNEKTEFICSCCILTGNFRTSCQENRLQHELYQETLDKSAQISDIQSRFLQNSARISSQQSLDHLMKKIKMLKEVIREVKNSRYLIAKKQARLNAEEAKWLDESLTQTCKDNILLLKRMNIVREEVRLRDQLIKRNNEKIFLIRREFFKQLLNKFIPVTLSIHSQDYDRILGVPLHINDETISIGPEPIPDSRIVITYGVTLCKTLVYMLNIWISEKVFDYHQVFEELMVDMPTRDVLHKVYYACCLIIHQVCANLGLVNPEVAKKASLKFCRPSVSQNNYHLLYNITLIREFFSELPNRHFDAPYRLELEGVFLESFIKTNHDAKADHWELIDHDDFSGMPAT